MVPAVRPGVIRGIERAAGPQPLDQVGERIEGLRAELERLTVTDLTPAEQAAALQQLRRLEDNVAQA
jgi:hypothetical protein